MKGRWSEEWRVHGGVEALGVGMGYFYAVFEQFVFTRVLTVSGVCPFP